MYQVISVSNHIFKTFNPAGAQFSFWNIGFISFIEPSATLSKVERNLRDLPISTRRIEENGRISELPFVTTLDLKRHEQASVGVNVNAGLIDIPPVKSTIYWNFFFYYGNVSLIDSTNQLFTQNEGRKTSKHVSDRNGVYNGHSSRRAVFHIFSLWP